MLALLEGGADPNLADENGETPLMAAGKRKNRRLAELLAGHGARRA